MLDKTENALSGWADRIGEILTGLGDWISDMLDSIFPDDFSIDINLGTKNAEKQIENLKQTIDDSLSNLTYDYSLNIDTVNLQTLISQTLNDIGVTNIVVNVSLEQDGWDTVSDYIAAGEVTAEKINVADLFAQDITATGTISGLTLKGGSININDLFSVDSDGNMVVKNGAFSGTISGSSITGGSISIGPTDSPLLDVDAESASGDTFINSLIVNLLCLKTGNSTFEQLVTAIGGYANFSYPCWFGEGAWVNGFRVPEIQRGL